MRAVAPAVGFLAAVVVLGAYWREVGVEADLLALWVLVPIAAYLLLDRRKESQGWQRVIAVSGVGAYAVLFAASAPGWDESSTGSTVFLFAPLAGLAAVLVCSGGLAWARRL